jgi:cobalt transporter subunit CbtB
MKDHGKVLQGDLGVMAAARTAGAMPAVFAIVFGIFLVFGAGFAQPSALHNAAHDARHAFALPCH